MPAAPARHRAAATGRGWAFTASAPWSSRTSAPRGSRAVHLVGGDDLLASRPSTADAADLRRARGRSVGRAGREPRGHGGGRRLLGAGAGRARLRRRAGDGRLTEVFEPAPLPLPPRRSRGLGRSAGRAGTASTRWSRPSPIVPTIPSAHRALGEALLAAGDARRAGGRVPVRGRGVRGGGGLARRRTT